MSGSISSGASPVQTYLTDTANELKQANASVAGNAEATNLIAYFQTHAGSVTSASSLLGNYKILSVVLGAYGLSSYANDTALVKALLTQDPTSRASVAYRSGNAKFIALGSAFANFKQSPLTSETGQTFLVNQYKYNLFEAAANTQTPGLQNALYFTRQAGSITSLTQLQSDANLLAVAVTGIGLPLTAFENLSFDQQTALLTQKFKVSDLQRPSYVTHLAELYLVQQQLSSGGKSAAAAPGSLASLFAGSSVNGTSTTNGNGVLSILAAGDSSSGGSVSLFGAATTSSGLLSLFA